MKEERITTEISIDPIQRRQIQLIQLEMLIELDRICKEHHIVYRLIGGTLIGAVRHKGFIPWDPDLDVSMDRKDYNRFFEICKTELDTERFFLQEWRTDPNYRWNYARMLRKDTEFVRAGHERVGAKNGIFIDIICADNVPDNKILRPLHSFSCFIIRKALWSEVGKDLHNNYFLRKWYKLISFIPRDWIFIFRDWVISWSDDKITQLKRNMAHKVSNKSPSKWGYPRKATIEELIKVMQGDLPWDYFTTYLEFEGYRFMVSKFYKDSLINTYGDYMELPPIEERKSHIPCSKLKLVKPKISNYDKLMENIYND